MATSSHNKFPSRFGRYILLDRINSGGMAEVFRAKVTGVEGFQRIIAIKCMLPALHQDEQFVTMFKDEAKLSSQLSHANIVQIHELGSIDDQLFIAMELINGRDLRHVVKLAKHKGAAVPYGFAAYVVSKAAEGLDYAHHKTGIQGEPLNLVHRDISPQNILVSYEGEVKVVDFGIAKAEERATETRAGVLKGKFAYMSPEQVMGQPLDARTDLFALGCVLYEVLTGKKLFAGQSDLSILDKVRNAAVPDFRVEIPDAPDALYEALTTALAKDPNDRFSRGHELAEALEPLLITDGRIFNDRRAREFMQELYADEIEELNARYQRYATITLDNEPEPEDLSSKTQIFESAFGGTQRLDDAAAAKPRMPTGDGQLSAEASRPRMPTGDGNLHRDASSQPRMPTGDGQLSGSSRPRMPTGGGDLADDGWGEAAEVKESRDPRKTQLDPLAGAEFTQAEGFFGPEAGEATAAFDISGQGLSPLPANEMQPLPPTTLGEDVAAAAAAEPPLTIPKPVVYASIFAAATAFLVLLLVALWPVLVKDDPATPAPVVLQVVDQPVGDSAAADRGQPNGPAQVTGAPSGDGQEPAEEPKDLSSNSIIADSSNAAEDVAAPEDDTADAEVDEDAAGKRRKARRPRKQVGYVSFLVLGAKDYKILVNGKDIGTKRFRVRLPVGTHKVTVVEQGGQGRSKTDTLKIGTSHTQSSPQQFKMRL